MNLNQLTSQILLLVAFNLCLMATNASSQTNLPCTPPPEGVIAWLPGDNNAIDTGRGLYGTLHNGASFTTAGNGKVGPAFNLDGGDDRIEIAGTSLQTLNSSFTFEAWINPASLSGHPVVFQKGSPTLNRIGLQVTSAGQLGGYMDSGGYTVSTAAGAIPTGVYSHVAFVFDDAANESRLYINGVLHAAAPEGRALMPNAGTLTIGNSTVSDPFPFNGAIDEPSLANRALASHEILAIYNSNGNGKCKPGRKQIMLVSTDGTEDSIKKFDPVTGEYLGDLVSLGNTPQSFYGLAHDGAGTLYVADFLIDRIMRYDIRTGAALGPLDPSNSIGLDGPVGITFGPDGKLYVADYSDRVLRYNFATSAFEVFIPTGTVVDPYDVEFGPDGNAYVSDSINNRILRYNGSTGALMGVFTSANMHYANFIRFHSDGLLYVSNYMNNSVTRYDASTGSLFGTFAHFGSSGGFVGFAFGPDGNLFIADNELQTEVKEFGGTTGAFLANYTIAPGTYPHDVLFLDAPCATTPNGQVAHYTADGTPEDSEGTADGHLRNGAFYARGKTGDAAFKLDGIDDYVQTNSTTTNSNGAGGRNLVSVEAWIRPLGMHDQNGTAHDGVIYYESEAATESAARLRLAIDESTGTIEFGGREVDGGPFKNVNSTAAPAVGQWTHVAGIWEAGTGLSIYVNGVLSGSLADPSLASLPSTATAFSAIGSHGSDAGHFNGEIDELSIYSSALSANDVARIHAAGKGGKCRPANACAAPPAQLASWWRGDGDAADQLARNNGSAVNVSYVAGKVGQGFGLNGTSSRVEIPESPSLNPERGSFTVEAWISTTTVSPSAQYVISRYECGGAGACAESAYFIYLVNGRAIGYARSQGASSTPFTDGLTLTGSRLVADGQFHHIVLQRDMFANQLRLYVDGTLETQATLNAGSNGVITSADVENDPIIIGAAHQSVTGNRTGFFSGVIDEVAFYGRALSEAEISAAYAAGTGGKCLSPDLSVSVSASTSSPQQSQPFTLSATITNTGFGLASEIDLSAYLPVNLTFVSADPGCAFDAATRRVSCLIGAVSNLGTAGLAPRASATRQIVVQPAASGNFTVPFTAAGGDADLVVANNLFLAGFRALAPTAATVSVSGRITTAGGGGIGNVSVTLITISGSSISARTNPLGYYRFEGVAVGQTVVISVSSKRYSFSPDTRSLSVVDDLTDIDFVADSPPRHAIELN